MPNFESSSKTTLSQVVENPSSFDFSISTLEDSPSTPVYGAGEMDESFTPQTEITAFHVPLSDEVLVCSPILVLSGDKSQNSEAQSMAKPSAKLLYEETEVGSMVVSSTITERLFERDLPERKGPDSCILTAGAELVDELRSPDQVPNRSEPIFDQTPKYLDIGSDKEEEEEIPLKWNSRGMLGGNKSQENIPELETVKGTPSIPIVEESAKQENEQQRKGKGKLVLTHPKGDKRKYVTRTETQKVMWSVITASKAQTERNRKMRREGVEPEQPASAPLSIKNSETESKDAAKGADIESGATKVLNGRVFDPNILTKFGMANLVNVVTIQGWNQLFESPIPYLHEPEVHKFFYKMELLEEGGIKAIVKNGCKLTGDFSKLATKREDAKCTGLPKKFLKWEYQLMFEFINKVMVPRTEKRTMA
ncbi:hypothetical protein H5410_042579 [Solanum commersonii]|uniref:Uncharacterized protein n=1 Tax=Solanum commersonii TaxID=4109 RepID=A0A9J5XV47_SOLCO|nr:hypothetical protein H5410_042579 [Solanum commersonii]